MRKFIDIITETLDHRLQQGFRVSWYSEEGFSTALNKHEFSTMEEAIAFLKEQIADGHIYLDYHLPDVEEFRRIDASTLI